MMTATAPAPEPPTVTLSPAELADLLGVDRADAGLLSTAPVRLPAAFVRGWGSRLGPLELTTAEVGLVLGLPITTLRDWIAKGLRARKANRLEYSIAPAALVEFLRLKVNRGKPPVPSETPRQAERRAAAAKARVAELCSKPAPKRRAAN